MLRTDSSNLHLNILCSFTTEIIKINYIRRRTRHFGDSVVVEELSGSGRVVGSVVDAQLNGVDARSAARELEAVVRRPHVLAVHSCASLFQLSAAAHVHVVDFHVVARDVRRVVRPSTQHGLDDGVLQNRTTSTTTAHT